MPYGLSEYVGAGIGEDPFRPVGSDQPGWSAIDLRPDASRLDGGGLNACLIYLPMTISDSRFREIGQDGDEVIGAAIRASINGRLRTGIRPDTVRETIANLLVGSGRGAWKELRPTGGVYEIWLNGLLWSRPTLRGGASFTDSYDRANNADLGADWTPNDGAAQIVNNRVRPTTAGADTWETVNGLTLEADEFARIDVATFAGANPGRIGGCVRCTTGAEGYVGSGRKNSGGDTTDIRKFVAGVPTILASETATTWASGDTLDHRAIGSTISILRNDSSLLSVTDTTFAGAGRVGIFLVENTTLADVEIESFLGGDFAGHPAARRHGGIVHNPQRRPTGVKVW